MAATATWTIDRVLALAPDPAAARAGRGLAEVRRWTDLGKSDDLLWGECRGDSGRSYRVKIALDGPAFSCPCPSRKSPCKHALGLLLIEADPIAPVPQGDPPPWAAGRIGSRAAEARRQRSAGPATAPPADPAGKARREAARLRKVAAGLDDLDRWLGDLVRAGFATLGARPKDLWDEQARRLVDAQCPGVARRLRQIDGMAKAGDGWQAALLDRLGQLHLLVEGFRRRDDLPAEVRDDLKGAIGFPADLDAARAGDGGGHVRDTWRVLGRAFALDDKLTVRRTWLAGRAGGRSALILDYAAPHRPFEVGFEPGTEVAATLGFLPGAAPLRALPVDRDDSTEPLAALDGGVTIDGAQAAFGAYLAKNPWVELIPVVLAAISLHHDDGTWTAIDPAGSRVPLARAFDRGWLVEALSGGAPITLAGEFDGVILNPLGALVGGRFVDLGSSGTPARPDPAGSPGRWLVPDSAALAAAAASATIGVDRKPLPPLPESHPAGAVLAEARDRPAPARLLATAATLGLAARAGRRPAVGAIPPLGPGFEAEGRPECPPRAADRLRGLIEGNAGDRGRGEPGPSLFLEWVAACDRAGTRLPADLLVRVLDRCRDWSGRRADVAAILGRRGAWLAARNPAWARYGPIPDPATAAATWEGGTRPERLALLQALRETDPAEARRLAATTFAADPAPFRAAVVDRFETNLGPDDEPFLEAALADRGRDVRSAAARRLRCLPDSRLSRRMAERARPLLAWDDRRDRLVVTLPPEPDEALLRDGMADYAAGWIDRRKVGERAWVLHQILALGPPAAIVDHLNRPPEAIVRAASKTEQAAVLRDAWEVAAIRHREPAWCLALARGRVGSGDLDDADRLAALLASLDPAERSALIADRLARSPDPLPATDPALKLITAAEGPLDVDLGRAILARCRGVLLAERLGVEAGATRPPAPAVAAHRALIDGLDRKLPGELLDEAAALVATPAAPRPDHATSLHASLDAMLDRWNFRRALHEEFAAR